MQDLKVTLVQADQFWEDKQANLENYDKLLANLEDTDLIVLPEMFHTGFSMNAEVLAEKMEKSLGIEWLQKKAKALNAAFYTSLIIEENNHYYNRGVFVYPNGKITTYDKRKSFGLAGEDKIYTRGTKNTIVELNGWKIQLQICYDVRFPEINRNKIDEKTEQPLYDLLLFVANWPAKRSLHWKTLLTARAIENQSYVIGVNRVGKDANNLDYSGDSKITNALGDVQNLTLGKQEVKTYNLFSNELLKIRKTLPFLKDQ
ncbi:nitrilase family protein [Crocinitomicaceae bacterium]|nr:nitrilase family protein [Crocinitomicaceae bacterium]